MGGAQLSQQAAARLGDDASNFHQLVVLAPPTSLPPMRLHPCQHCQSYHLALPLLMCTFIICFSRHHHVDEEDGMDNSYFWIRLGLGG
jgi:hypothetical protein